MRIKEAFQAMQTAAEQLAPPPPIGRFETAVLGRRDPILAWVKQIRRRWTPARVSARNNTTPSKEFPIPALVVQHSGGQVQVLGEVMVLVTDGPHFTHDDHISLRARVDLEHRDIRAPLDNEHKRILSNWNSVHLEMKVCSEWLPPWPLHDPGSQLLRLPVPDCLQTMRSSTSEDVEDEPPPVPLSLIRLRVSV